LAKEARVTVLLARSPDQFDTKEAQTNFERLRDVQILAGLDRSEEAIAEADLLIDALLGIGAEGNLREPFASLIRQVNASGKPVLSVDVPSGLGTGLMVRPTVTVTLHDVKEGMTPDNSGRIRIADIGIPSKVTTMIGPGEFLLYPLPRATSHKGENGRLLVVAGGPYTGAPALVGFGSLGIGIDLVHIATPASAATVVAAYSPTFIVHPLVGHRLLREDLRQIIELTPRVDAVAIGPGLGDAAGTLDAIREVVRGIQVPMVLDADAIKAVAVDPKCLAGKKAVLTPHSREFQLLSGKSLPDAPEERAEMVRETAKALGATILLKGHVDIVTDGTRLKFNYTGNPGMTAGGTGDVLCGLTAGLIAKGMAPYDAARLAAFTNGAAGDLAFEEKSYGLTSLDVANHLGHVLAKFL
jgi:NAD(P)H-hydrate epimerase